MLVWAGTHQLDWPSLETKLAWITLSVKIMIRKGSRSSVRGLPMAQPMMTTKGSTKMAIWMLDPRATPMAKSILSCKV